MIYPSVPSESLRLQPLSLFEAACSTFTLNTPWNKINDLFLKHDIPRTVYDALWQTKVKRRNEMNNHDWSKPGPVSTNVYLSLFDDSFLRDIEEPTFYYEDTILKRRFVTMILEGMLGKNIYNYCPTCWNTYVRFNTDKFQSRIYPRGEFIYVQQDLLIEGEQVIDYLRKPCNWCHRCYTTVLCSIHDSQRRYADFWAEPEELLSHETVLLPMTQ